MLDNLSNPSNTAWQQDAARFNVVKRRPSRRPKTFLGVDVIVGWEGSACELVQALRHLGLERLFVLRSISRGTRIVWRDGEYATPFNRTVVAGYGTWLVRFDATPETRNRAEAHLPRLLESISSRMDWQQVEKRQLLPEMSISDPGESSNPSPSEQRTGGVA